MHDDAAGKHPYTRVMLATGTWPYCRIPKLASATSAHWKEYFGEVFKKGAPPATRERKRG